MSGVKRATPGADDEKNPLANVEVSEADAKKLEAIQDQISRVDLLLQYEEIKRYLPVYESRRQLVKTIPRFWPVALMNNETFIMHVQHAGDAQALSYLEDLWVVKDQKDPRAFTLEFYFKENPYFSDSVLKKTFAWVPNSASDNTPDANGISKANVDFNWDNDIKSDATKIAWKDPDQALTKLYPRATIEEDDDFPADSGSFFTFFEEAADPFELGIAIAEEIFPHAIQFFLGKTDDDIDSEDEEDGDDEEEIDLEKPKAKKQKV